MRFLMLNWRDPKNPLAGGAERVSLGYMAALVQRGHQAFWFTNAFPGCASSETIEGVEVIRRGRTGTSIAHARAWVRQQPRFDLVIDQHHGIPWFAPWWSGTRCVAYVHEVLGPIWNAFYPWPISAIGRAQERWMHRLYRNVPFWTASHATAHGLRRNGAEDITIIPYGVHTRALPSLEPKPLGVPLRLVVVSRLAPNKRIDHAIRALAALRQRGVAARLVIVGSGEMEAALRAAVASEKLVDQVEFRGSLPEQAKDDALAQAHYLLHTSQREGWGLNVIEANAMGTPAVVYPVEGLTESTLHEQTGLVAENETPGAVAAQIIRSLEQPDRYESMRQAAWERAKTFHWSVVLPKACDWLEQQAARPR